MVLCLSLEGRLWFSAERPILGALYIVLRDATASKSGSARHMYSPVSSSSSSITRTFLIVGRWRGSEHQHSVIIL